jgi:hypothetical protein
MFLNSKKKISLKDQENSICRIQGDRRGRHLMVVGCTLPVPIVIKVMKHCSQFGCFLSFKIDVGENQRGNQEWRIQRHWPHWAHMTQDEDKTKKTNKQTNQTKIIFRQVFHQGLQILLPIALAPV